MGANGKLHSAGKPVWGTLIALLHDGVPVLGMLNQPITHERWVGVAGKPTTLNGVLCLLCDILGDFCLVTLLSSKPG